MIIGDRMKTIETKEDIYKVICNASLLGTLGLFVGSGFTKSILDGNSIYDAYTWGELLEQCCLEMDVDKDILKSKGSYPEIASKICKQHSINENNITYKEAVSKMKSIICKKTTVFPDDRTRQEYEDYFLQLNFNWIATTNYDTIIESILNGRAFSISPDGCFTKIAGLVPVYHIHGSRNTPDSIVITNEDYAYLFRPNDYRQARLPFLMKESLVLMIGYGLGDINVLTAVDWSKNVYTNTNEDYDFPIIQLLYKEYPKDKPYLDDSGIIIYEINDLHNFFSNLSQYMTESREKNNELLEKVNRLISKFTEADGSTIDDFISNKDFYRTNTNKYVASLNQELGYIYISYLNFLRRVIDELNYKASQDRAFKFYNKKLNVLLDIFINVPLKKMPPSFFTYIVQEFDSVAYYVGDSMGKSWNAQKTWNNRKHELPEEMKLELLNYINSDTSYGFSNAKRLLKNI